MNAIGDIAGQHDALMRLIDKMPKQRTILLGDLNDRGSKSKDVIQWAMDNQNNNVITLHSNHGDMFIDWFYNKTLTNESYNRKYSHGIFEYNGGIPTIESYGIDVNNFKLEDLLNNAKMAQHIHWLGSLLKFTIESVNGQDYIFTHAPLSLRSDESLYDVQDDIEFIWNRKEPNRFPLPNTVNVFGHNTGYFVKLFCKQYRNGIYVKDSNMLRDLIDLNKNEVYGICLDTSSNGIITGLDLNTMTIYTEKY